jgi:hypothetical protein
MAVNEFSVLIFSPYRWSLTSLKFEIQISKSETNAKCKIQMFKTERHSLKRGDVMLGSAETLGEFRYPKIKL